MRFVRAGWRPALGWVGALAVLQEFVLRHYLGMPGSDAGQLVALVSLLVLHSGIRAFEKAKGTDDATPAA
jgi:hypothetical protein